MNKRGIIITLFTFLLIATTAYAIDMEDGLGDLFDVFGKIFLEGFENNTYGIRILFMLLLFTVFNFALKNTGTFSKDTKTAGIISFLVALLVVIFIPEQMISRTIELYGWIVMTLLGLVLPLYILVEIYKKIEGEGWGFHFSRAILLFLIFTALQWFLGNIEVFY